MTESMTVSAEAMPHAMTDLGRVTRAELTKLRRRPATWVLLATAVLLNLSFGYLVPYLSYRSGGGSDMTTGSTPEQLLASTLPGMLVTNTIGAFAVFSGALALVFGALVVGGEHGAGTLKTLFAQGPGRLAVVGGQLAALGAALVVGLVAMFAAGLVTSVAIAVGEGRTIALPGAIDLVEGFGAGLLILGMWALLGAVLATLLRGVALPIGLGVVWILGVENLLAAMAGSVWSALEPVRDVLPGVNAGSFLGAVLPNGTVEPPPGVNTSVDGTRALVTLGVYVVVCAAVTLWSTRRRDVA